MYIPQSKSLELHRPGPAAAHLRNRKRGTADLSRRRRLTEEAGTLEQDRLAIFVRPYQQHASSSLKRPPYW